MNFEEENARLNTPEKRIKRLCLKVNEQAKRIKELEGDVDEQDYAISIRDERIAELEKELADANNSFGSQSANWPGLAGRIEDLKARSRSLWRENERLRTALQEVWDCEADIGCPNCKLVARQALEGRDG